MENFKPSQLRTFDVSRSFLSTRSARFSTRFNARVIAHLKQSSSSFLRLIIAFFAARNDGSGIEEKPSSGSYFTVFRSRLKTERNLKFLPCLGNFAKDSKTVFLIFEFSR